MMGRRRAAAFLLGLLIPTLASAWDIEWVDQYGNGIFVDASGGTTDGTGVYLAGSVFGALPGQIETGEFDVYLRKYDVAGHVLFTRQFGTPVTDAEFGVVSDSTGVYVSGATAGNFPDNASAGRSDAFVRKFSADGEVLWTRQFGTAGTDVPMLNGVVSHTSGVYVAGETTGTFPGAASGTGLDLFLARLDRVTGHVAWVRQFGFRGTGLRTSIGGVSVDDTGVYATGFSTLDQNRIALVRKYDFDGHLLWARDFAGFLGCSATFWDLAAHAGAVYVVGQWNEPFFEDPAACKDAGQGHADIVGGVLKYDAAGNLLWKRRLKGAGEGINSFTGAKRVWASATGVYVGANLTTTFPGGRHDGPRRDLSECPGLAPGNLFTDKLDAYVRRYDFDGNVIWTHQFGSDVFDLVRGIGGDATGVYVAGVTSCQIDDGEAFSGGGGTRDAFVLRFSVEPTSLEGRVQLLIGRLETLDDAHRFAPGEFGSLVQKLETAFGALQVDRSAARQKLEAFVSEVSVMVDRGTLSASEGGALAGAANDVIAQL